MMVGSGTKVVDVKGIPKQNPEKGNNDLDYSEEQVYGFGTPGNGKGK